MLFDKDLSITEGFKDFYKSTNQQGTYEEFIKLMKDMNCKLSGALSKYQNYF